MNLEITYKDSESFVKTQRNRGARVRWEGWDMVFFIPSKRGFNSKDGKFYNGRWGFEHRVQPDDRGIWRVNDKYVFSGRGKRV